ncbi:histidinol-phosphate transaminase [bacterium]|nr:MAG: histidinol-phosphate transaminase [bacterium]
MTHKKYTPAHRSVEDLMPYQTGKPIEEVAREMGLEKIVKLASNENPLGLSPLARDAARSALEKINRYPDGGMYELRNKLAQKHQVSPDVIVLGNGSNEILELLVQLLLGEDEETLYGWPSFIVYRLATLAHGARGVEVPLDEGLRHDLKSMAGAVTPKTRIVFVANPNNPTGTYVTRTDLEEFMEQLPEHVLVVLDEAYYEYAVHLDDYPDGMELFREGRSIVVTRTFSKAYGLAGLRIGYAVMPESLAQLMNRIRQPFNVNFIAQITAMAAMEDEEFLSRSLSLNRVEMKRVTDTLEKMGLKVIPSAANFLLVDLKGRSGDEIYRGLLERGVIVRPMASYGLPETIRVTVGLEEENDLFLAALAEII